MLVPALLAVVGAALVLTALGDALWTTLWLEGHAGPLTRRVTAGLRRVMRAAVGTGTGRPATPKQHRRLSLTGPIVLASCLLMWISILWVGWVAVFSADATSVTESHTHARASLVDRVYFVGYVLTTIGNGDFVPSPGVWRLATTAVGLSGLLLVTLTVTYVLAIVGAVVRRRSFATQVFALGDCAEAFVVHAWDGERFPALELQLFSLIEQLSLVTEQHQAYPMLHYYHEEKEHTAAAAAVVVLDDALALLEAGVRREARPAPLAIRVGRASVEGYLDTLRAAYIEPADHDPPSPELARLRAAGIPTVADDEFAAYLRGCTERRRLLVSLVESESREWPPPKE